MDREFKSKVGWWYHLVLFVMIVTTLLAFIGGTAPFAMIVLLLGTLLCIHMLLSTWYRVTEDGWLVVHCSIFPEKKVAIADITALEETSNLVSSYALSLDRLMVWVGNKPWMLISPANKKEFIRLLCKINSDIILKS